VEIAKGHVIIADLDPRMGTEPGKVRPVVVVQSDLLNGVHPSTVVCPVSTRIRPGARLLRVHLSAGEGGLKEASDILVDQVRAVDNRRFVRVLGKISRRSLVRLVGNLRILLD